MASRPSDSTRTTQKPSRTPAPVSTQAATSAPTHKADPPTAQSQARSPGKAGTKAAPRRAARTKADPALAPLAVSADERRAMIARAAYFNAQRRGFASGGEVQDWLAAEAEVDALLKTASGMPQ